MLKVHYVYLVIMALVAGLPNLEMAFPPSATPWLKGTAACLALVATVLGIFSPAAQSRQTTPTPLQPPAND